MPYDNTGTFTRLHSWEQDRLDGISIDSSRMDADSDDIANGLSQCMLRSGSMAMQNALNMAGYKVQNVGDGTVSTDAVNKGQLDTQGTTLSTSINSLDAQNVKLTGNQTIADTKTFSSSPIIPTPSASDNSTKAATTAFIKSYIAAALVPDYSSRTSISSGYTATKNGIVYLTQSKGNVDTTVAIDGHNILYMSGHSGSSHGQPRPCATAIIGAGQKITFANIQYAYFVPFNY